METCMFQVIFPFNAHFGKWSIDNHHMQAISTTYKVYMEEHDKHMQVISQTSQQLHSLEQRLLAVSGSGSTLLFKMSK